MQASANQPGEYKGMSHSQKTTPRRFLCVLLLLPSLSWAATACQTIQDPDQRAYCRAVQTGSKGQCTAIGNYDLRQQCLVRLGSNPSLCSTTTPGWNREQCKDAARRK